MRWGIEVFRRTLKSRCRIKDRQLGIATFLQACLGVDMVATGLSEGNDRPALGRLLNESGKGRGEVCRRVLHDLPLSRHCQRDGQRLFEKLDAVDRRL